MENWIKYYKKRKYLDIIAAEPYIINMLLNKNYSNLIKSKSNKNSNILDLSCGYGRNLSILTRIYKNVYATEISDEIIEIAKSNYLQVKYKKGTIAEIPFPNNFLYDWISFEKAIIKISFMLANIKILIE